MARDLTGGGLLDRNAKARRNAAAAKQPRRDGRLLGTDGLCEGALAASNLDGSFQGINGLAHEAHYTQLRSLVNANAYGGYAFIRNMKSFKDRLEHALILRGKDQAGLARHLKVTPSTVSSWFVRGSEPKFSVGAQVAEYLDVPVLWLALNRGPAPVAADTLDGPDHLLLGIYAALDDEGVVRDSQQWHTRVASAVARFNTGRAASEGSKIKHPSRRKSA